MRGAHEEIRLDSGDVPLVTGDGVSETQGDRVATACGLDLLDIVMPVFDESEICMLSEISGTADAVGSIDEVELVVWNPPLYLDNYLTSESGVELFANKQNEVAAIRLMKDEITGTLGSAELSDPYDGVEMIEGDLAQCSQEQIDEFCSWRVMKVARENPDSVVVFGDTGRVDLLQAVKEVKAGSASTLGDVPRCLLMPVKIGMTDVLALLDTGAMITVVAISTYKKCIQQMARQRIRENDHRGIDYRMQAFAKEMNMSSASVKYMKQDVIECDVDMELKEDVGSANPKLENANGTSIPVLGVRRLPLYIGEKKLMYRVVVAQITEPMIIGFDLLFTLGATIDLRDASVRMR